ncbi:MAG: UDP-N-acetylmuramate dehydrogenase [Parachlamydiales bacterium]
MLKNRTLKELTTFKIGGCAKYFFAPQTFDEMKEALKFANESNLKFFILGKGSNILFDDDGFNGIVIQNNISFFKISKNNVFVGGGYSFPNLGLKTASLNLSGLEFALGIPGSVGGAVYMNASSFDRSVSDVLKKVVVLDEFGKVQVIDKKNIEFAYRFSSFQKTRSVILSAQFELQNDNNVKEKQSEMLQKKIRTQPMNEKNAGCVFKNPKGYSAGRLIEECGLKNYSVGGARVSSLHANFIINANNATAQDVIKLISDIKGVVKKEKNILLEEEIKIIKC